MITMLTYTAQIDKSENNKKLLYETLQACASISVPKLCNFHLQYLVNFVKN